MRVGRELGLDERALKRLELGALLHDIGKIGIPSDILSKPGRLTAEERAVIETHPALGERIIAPIDRLQEVRPIVRHCHERWDGVRLSRTASPARTIPLESRIIFVCDAYHAMTTDRPYRKRLSHPEAVRRLREGAGSQFDAERRRGRARRASATLRALTPQPAAAVLHARAARQVVGEPAERPVLAEQLASRFRAARSARARRRRSRPRGGRSRAGAR